MSFYPVLYIDQPEDAAISFVSSDVIGEQTMSSLGLIPDGTTRDLKWMRIAFSP